MAYGKAKEMKKIIARLEAQGWRVVRKGTTHYQCFAPDGVTICHVAQPSSAQSLANHKALLRKAGADLD